jgi:hemoglobin-like flavoprotein
VKSKVVRGDYDKVLRALLWTLEALLADDLTPEIRHAWITVYGMIAEIMIDAAED